MPDVTLVQGDTRPALKGTLTTISTGAPLVLTGAQEVRFQMRQENDRRYSVDGAAAIVNASTGQVQYSWAANDLTKPGVYQAQWQILWGDGSIQTTEPPNEIEVRRQ